MAKRGNRTCNKVAYPNASAARHALRILKARGMKRFYLCPVCPGKYHLTSTTKNYEELNNV